MASVGQINNVVYYEANDAKRERLVEHLRSQTSSYGMLNGARIIDIPASVSKSEAQAIAAAAHDWKAPGVVIIAAAPEVKVKGMLRSKTKTLQELTALTDLNEIHPADLYKADTKHPHVKLEDGARLAIVAADTLATNAAKDTLTARDTNHRDNESTMGIPPEELEEMRRRQQRGNGTSTERTAASRLTGPIQR